ncbi:MAG: tetratricopeptide repeat protein [Pseudomonadota bacterium]
MSRTSPPGRGSKASGVRAAPPGPPPEFLAAVQHHRAGRLREAEAAYRQVIARFPRAAEAHGLLGFLAHQAGEPEAALAHIATALALNPRFVDAHLWQGMALQALGRFAEAEAAYRRTLELSPRHFDALNNLGTALLQQGRPAEAATLFERAIAVVGTRAEAHYNLGNALKSLGKTEDAATRYRRALALKPDSVEAQTNLGVALVELRRPQEALPCLERAVALDPTRPESHFNLGRTLKDLARTEQAEASYRTALELQPEYPDARISLASLLIELGRREEAVEHLRYTVETSPESVAAASSLLMMLNYDPDLDPAAVAQEHRRLGAAIVARVRASSDKAERPPVAPAKAGAQGHRTSPTPWVPAFAGTTAWNQRSRDPERRLKLGYLSPDYRAHSCAFFIEPLFAAHDRAQVEVIAYSNTPTEDGVTERIKGLVDGWRPVRHLDDDALARLVAGDAIDILIDLAGHTDGGRPSLLALKPAPILVAWLGYPNSTGLSTVDCRITDAVADPPGAADAHHTERLLRLPRCFLCYRPPADAPDPALTGPAEQGAPVFGCFNTAPKLNPAVARLWARILNAVPGARLKLRALQFRYAAATEAARAMFAGAGVDPARLALSAWRPTIREGLADYDGIDVALDPFPYNGTTTTCEALWMGVPVVTLEGRAHAGRVGASLLSALGLADALLARDPDDYVAKAVALAQDRARLRRWRAELRARMAASPLMDGGGFARALEAGYREAWRRWCEGSEDCGS